jgi:hypothetical protein
VANVITIITTAADNAFTGGAGDDGTGNVLPATGPGLFAVTYPEIVNIITDSPAQVAVLNSNFNSLCAQVTQEQNLQSKAQIDFGNLIANSATTVYSLVDSLPSYGRQTEQGGMAQFWEGVANINTFTGQAVVATLREGLNLSMLGNAGIRTDSIVPDTPNPPIPTANLISSTYTAEQAANLVVK